MLILLFYSFMFAAPPLPPPLLIIAIWTALPSLLLLRSTRHDKHPQQKRWQPETTLLLGAHPRHRTAMAATADLRHALLSAGNTLLPLPPDTSPSIWRRFRSFSFSLFGFRSFSFVATVTGFSLCVLEHALLGCWSPRDGHQTIASFGLTLFYIFF